MPTQSEPAPRGEWAARTTDTSKRSVFGNYRAEGAPASGSTCPEVAPQRAGPETGAPLQSAIDLAMARSFIHRFLAKAYEDPMPETWRWLTQAQTIYSLRAANVFAGQSLLRSAEALISALQPAGFDSFLNAYLAAFGHAARGSCPLNEIEYGDIKADPLFQPHRLADLAAFYRAFGLEVAEDAGERQDHICLELEFMCVLAAKEAYAHEHQVDADQLAQCRDAQKKFLREHLGRWTPAFARRLAAATNEPALRALAEFTRAFVESECVRFGVNPGSEELSLRPVDEAADRACDSCGINNLPPGALAAEAAT
ncbi:MAG: molecular chaperone TorD family protein [Verrucomicrobia bacterium]|jgi:DMSO reductase family type II enzyme chaperone|nr:molecular chaperone TorD family protein [Verrucomicrobiota bacterium]